MKKLVIAGSIFILVCVVHILLLFKKGYQPPVKKIMSPSEFSRPEDIGAALARRFWVDLREKQVVVLATSKALQTGMQIWGGFVSASKGRGIEFKHEFTEPIDWTAVKAAVADGGGKVLLHMSSSDTLAEVVKSQVEGALLLMQAPFVVRSEDEQMLGDCVETENFKMRESVHLSCNSLEVSRRYYRKKLSKNKLIAVVENPSGIKQVLYVHEPEASK